MVFDSKEVDLTFLDDKDSDIREKYLNILRRMVEVDRETDHGFRTWVSVRPNTARSTVWCPGGCVDVLLSEGIIKYQRKRSGKSVFELAESPEELERAIEEYESV